MPSFASSALRLMRQLLGGPSTAERPYAGTETTLDGNTAVAVTEAGISEGAALGASFPADTADLAWRAEQERHGTNLWGAALISRSAEGPRGALAAATGLALSGCRATAFLSGQDLAACQDLLTNAAGRRLPLVLHLDNRALAGQAATLGSGHEAVHQSADTGCFLLFAANVQEAVDFTLIARRVAELTLTPGLVIMDGERTALSIQDVRLPPPELVESFVGTPQDAIPSPTSAQKMLFGDQRRRVPRWHNPDRPVLLGASQPTTDWGVGKISGRLFMEAGVDEVLDASLRLFAKHTGRRHRPVSAYRMDDAEIVLVAQGAAIETAEAAAERARIDSKLKIGVLGLRTLRPFPSGLIAELLAGSRQVCVLERMDDTSASDPPLTRELRACLGRALEHGRLDGRDHPGYPGLVDSGVPPLLSVIYGLGGMPLRGSDLVELCARATAIDRSRLYLGIDLAPQTSPYPKRQVLLDALRRSYPDIAGQGLRAGPEPVDLRPKDTLTLAVHRISGQANDGLCAEAAGLLRRLVGGQLRSRPAMFAEPGGTYCQDLLSSAPQDLRDPGDQVPVDLALVAADPELLPADALRDMTNGSVLLLDGPASGSSLPAALHRTVVAKDIKVYGAATSTAKDEAQGADSDLQRESLLGALFSTLVAADLVDLKPRRLGTVREEALAYLPEDRRKTRLESFNRGIQGVERLDPSSLRPAPDPSSTPNGTPSEAAPALVSGLGNMDQLYDSLPRFRDQVGAPLQPGESAEPAPDPYAAVGAIPPLSAAFRDLSRLRDTLPRLDPLACTGCGVCWSRCPDGAIGATALQPGGLIDAGIGITGASALRPLVSKLGTRMAARCAADRDTGPATFGSLLNEAFEWLQGKMALPAERKQNARSAVEELLEHVGGLPFAVTEPFFHQPETASEGSGELLILALNPDTCKGCGICIQACEPGAWSPGEQNPGAIAEARALWRSRELLPATAQETIRRVAGHPDLDPLAPMLLSQQATRSLVGGDGAEPGSGERLAIRLALAAIEHRQQPLKDAFVREVRANEEKIAGLIRDSLADALPADDLDALSRALESVDSRHADLNALLNDAEQRVGGSIDTIRMRRLVALARGLEVLAKSLSRGRQGFGRASAGVVLSADGVSGWSGVFPHNPFSTPCVVDLTGDGAQLAAGLLEGQLRQAIEGFVLVRKARLELESAADAARLGSSLDALTWQELTPDEQALCPPLLLAGSAAVLGRKGLAQVEWMLATDLPIKVLMLADLDLGLATRSDAGVRPAAVQDTGIGLALPALAHRRALIAQSSLAAPAHLARSLEKACDYRGPALLHLHAPSPARHGFAPDRTLEQAQWTLQTRALPLFLYDPQGDGVFGSRLSLDGNPETLAALAAEDDWNVSTPAQWALTERRFSAYFHPLGEDAPSPEPVSVYLALDEPGRALKTPFVESSDEDGEKTRLAVDPLLVKACDERLHAWRVLQELSGLVTPFTDRIEQEARDRVAAAHAAEMAALKVDYESRIADLRSEMLADTRDEIRERLMALAGYRAPDAGAGESTGVQ